jgi:hypothetical protein
MTFACPHCGTDIRITLVLDEPPRVKVRWDENAEEGSEEGAIINIGAGFAVRKEKMHEDFYFPSFDAPRPTEADFPSIEHGKGPAFFDTAVVLGTLPHAAARWSVLQRALRFHRTGQVEHRNAQLRVYWGEQSGGESIDEALYNFLLRFLAPIGESWLSSAVEELKVARRINSEELSRLASHYERELKNERFKGYEEIFTEYFRGFGDYGQTLVYVRRDVVLPMDSIASSTDFEKTRMFYGNAFEVLGSHLDLVAAINNIVAGRAFDQMQTMDLKKFRGLNKANRVQCFADNKTLSWFVNDYDSSIRNASHHRWFKLDDARTNISYRSGGTGTLKTMTYAQYLVRCNRIASQLMILAALELVLLSISGKSL